MLKIHTDGGARGNPGPAASAFVVYDDTGEVVFSDSKYLGPATNNLAEYTAVLLAIEWLGQNNSSEQIEFYLDSLLVASQLQGTYKIKNSDLKNIYLQIQKIISEKKLSIKKFIYVPREKNFLADSLVNQTLDNASSA